MTLSDSARRHVAAMTRAWLGVTTPTADVPAMPDALARRLLRLEEFEHSHRDQWGNWEFAFCDAYRDGRLWQPDVDRWLDDCRRQLGLDGRTRWPDGRPFAICLSHDVDLVSDGVTPGQALRSMRLAWLGDGRSARDRALRFARPGVRAVRALRDGISTAPRTDALERCLEIEKRNDVSATYFFTAYPGGDGHRFDCVYDFGDRCRFGGSATTVAELMRSVDRDGFEVGLHGSYNSALLPGRLAAEKAAIEQATGLSVTSTRQHFLHWDIRRTPTLQQDAGFSADSTLGFNRNIGLRSGTSLPFRLFDVDADCAFELVELPIVVSDPALLRGDALELGPELSRETLRAMLDRVSAVGGVATLVFHPNNLVQVDYLRLFEDAVAYGRDRGAWFASVRDLDGWFRTREAVSHT
jgi:peptidoglycan/xylan/chitin deacetylase (PgdA/CDA1 family)